jgi:Uncharacterized protein conserved in bacteria (DUF2252)
LRLLHPFSELLMNPLAIKASVARYEAFLRESLGDDLVKDDLDTKHDKMRKSPFLFLRATCWRWAETAHTLCPDLKDAPRVLALGDAHLENFGLWHDAEGRLVWGANDFDEAAQTPYAYDLVRLTASTLLALPDWGAGAESVARKVLEGYAAGLAAPRPFVLDGDHHWLRSLFIATKARRKKFWRKLGELPAVVPPARYADALGAALPQHTNVLSMHSRRAGCGSRGLPRFVVYGEWRGGPIAREVKALVRSCWNLDRPEAPADLPIRLASGAFRSPDPWLSQGDGSLVRRFGPNARNLELKDIGRVRKRLVRAMGHELANLHAASANTSAIVADLEARKPSWLANAATAVVEATVKDFKEFRKS